MESLDGEEEIAILDLEGFIDTATAPQFKKEIENLINNNIYKIIINFAKITYLSSSGIGVFIETISEVKKNQGNIVIVRASDKIEKVINIAGLGTIIKIHSSEQEAKEKFVEEKKLLKEKKSSLETIQFPFKKQCPFCKQTSWVPRADILRCPKCDQIFYINRQGDVTPLKNLDKTHMEMNKYKFEVKIPSDINYLNHVRIFLTGLLRTEKINEENTNVIELAIDEVVSNIVEHAYNFEKHHTVDITFYIIPNSCFVAKIKDKGKSIGPLIEKLKSGVKENVVPLNQERGRGFNIINKIMDKIEYQSITGLGNELTMVKHFQKAKEQSDKNKEMEILKNE